MADRMSKITTRSGTGCFVAVRIHMATVGVVKGLNCRLQLQHTHLRCVLPTALQSDWEI